MFKNTKGKKKKRKKKSSEPVVQLSDEELRALEAGDDEVLRRYAERRIRARRKAQRKRKQQRIQHLALLVIILCLGGMNFVFGARYVNNLLKVGGKVLDGDAAIVLTAREQLGNYGGKKFWKWYGFDYQVDWCACFVSWCANQNGYIDDGKVPMSCYVPEQVAWFSNRGRFKKPSKYTPKAGDIIFFDWEHDGSVDHVGIVASVFRGKVYTIEGNSGYTGKDESKWKGECKRNRYDINSKDIFGYGLIETSSKSSKSSK
jgi:hypothetical protein